jgi:hypothetical protein
MPIRSFKSLPRTLTEWGRFFNEAHVEPSEDSVGTPEIRDGQVTFPKIQAITPGRLLGRATSPAGTVQELTVGGGVELTGSGIQRSELIGDVTAAAGSGETTIPDETVTYAKIQNVSATDRILGRQAVGAGVIEEIVCTAAGRALLDDVDASAQRTTLGLGTAATQNTGTSGSAVPLLSGANTWSGAQAYQLPPVLPTYNVAALPSAATYARGLIYVNDDSTGAVIAFSDGTDWRRVTDRNIVS